MRARATVILEAERDRLPLFLPVLMGAGVAAYFGLRSEPALWPALAAAALGFCCLAVTWRSDAARMALLAALSILAGFLAAQFATRRALPMEALPRHAVVVVGRVCATDVLPEGGRRLTIASASLDGAPPLRRLLHVRLRDNDASVIGDGAIVSVRALLRAPSPPAFPGARDLRRDAFYGGLAGSGFALGFATTDGRRPAGGAGGIGGWWQSVRDRIAARIRIALPGTEGAIASTLLVGIASAIPDADRQAFADSGLAHLLAVAGLHIGIVMGLVLGLVRTGFALSERLSLRWPTREISFVAALLAGGLYMVATGAHVPIIRSFAMATLATGAILLGRRAVSLRGLAVAAVVILAVWPEELTGVSFQMSFAAVAALISGYEVARPVFARLAGGGHRRRVALHLLALALTSLIAGLASMPYAAFHFGRVQLYFVLANLVAVPLTASWIMPWGLAALALMPAGFERVALVPMGWGIHLVLLAGRLVASCPGAVGTLPALPLGFLLLSSVGIALLCLFRTPIRLAGLAFMAAALAAGAAARPPDLLVSDDGALVAWDGPGGAFTVEKGRGVSRRSVEDAERLWGGASEPVRLPYDGEGGGAACSPGRCLVPVRGARVLIFRDKGVDPNRRCDGVAVAVSARFLPRGCDAAVRLDRRAARRNGATALWFGGGRVVRVATDLDWSGARPWTADPAPAEEPALRALAGEAVAAGGRASTLPFAPVDQ